MAENLRIYLLGEFRLYRDGALITHKDWHTRQARQLFKLLLTERGRTVSMRKLTYLLWSDYADSAYKTLRSAVSALRSVLEPERDPQTPSRFVPRGHAGYTLIFPADSAVWIDVVEFERQLDQVLTAPQANSKERRKLLERALQLYTGDYLAQDEDASWARAERVRLRERYFTGVTALAEWQYEAGLYQDAIELCRQALKFDGCRELLYRLMMQSQAQLGDSGGALQTFEQCRQLLDEHLGADPSPQTLQLHTAILRGEFQARAPHPLHLLPAYRSPACVEHPFVGRKAELDQFMRQLDEVQTQPAQHARTIALVGEAGIGKSFLLRLFLHHASAGHVHIMTANCQAIEQHVAFAPLVSMVSAWLLEASEEQLQTLPLPALSPVATLIPELVRRLPDIAPLA